MSETVKEFASSALGFVVMLVFPAAWLTGLFASLQQDSFLWFCANMIIPPVGIISGFVQWLS